MLIMAQLIGNCRRGIIPGSMPIPVFQRREILSSPAGALIRNQVGYGYDRNFQSFQKDVFSIGISALEFDTADVGNDVDSAWAIANLKHSMSLVARGKPCTATAYAPTRRNLTFSSNKHCNISL
jgi:hypothetical protein